MTRKVLISLAVVIVVAVGWFVYGLFGPAPKIVVSKETTWLTEPLADDGLPDYAKWLLDRQREGVTPENNAAIPLLQALWADDLFAPHADLVCEEIGMEVPEPNEFSYGVWKDEDGIGFKLWLSAMEAQGIDSASPMASLEEYEDSRERWKSDSYAPYDESPEASERHDSPSYIAIRYAEGSKELVESKPWTREQFPPLAAWVDKHAKEFELLHEAARREKYYCPSPTLLNSPQNPFFDISFDDISVIRSAARSLSMRAMMHLGEGDYAAAWADVKAIHNIAEHLPQRTLIEQLVRIAVHGVAYSAAWEILASESINIATAKEIYSYYAGQRIECSMTQAFDEGERLFFITAILALSGPRAGEDSISDVFGSLGGPPVPVETFSLDWNLILREGNRWYDRLAEISRIDDRNERKAAMAKLMADLNAIGQNVGPVSMFSALVSRESRSNLLIDLFMAMLLPAVDALENASDRTTAERQLTQIAAALCVYRCEHGEYPDSLDAMVPHFLPELPKDNYTGALIAYTKTTDGYLLVKLGPNGTDDHGSNSQRGIYKGISLGYGEDDELAKAMEFLGEPVPRDEVGEIDFLELKPIPEGADDLSLRIPQPPVEWLTLPDALTE